MVNYGKLLDRNVKFMGVNMGIMKESIFSSVNMGTKVLANVFCFRNLKIRFFRT